VSAREARAFGFGTRSRVLLLLLLLPAVLGVKRPDGLGDVTEVRTWSHPDYTRVVVELTRPVEASEVKRLAANASAKRPERLYLDLDRIWVGREYVEGILIEDGLLKDVRLGQNTLTKTRLVIDLERYQRHRVLTLSSPHRLVIDVYGERGGSGQPRWPAPERPNDARLSMPLRPVQKVVIDAGHGGKDPGAIGVGGLREKDINLRLARLVGKQLKASGFQVVYTRTDDRYLSLEERTVVAEAAGGDVFVSIHANASRRKKTRGIEIYYLDENHERHSLNVAARENGVSRGELDSLQRTLARLRVSEASSHSSRLATYVHDAVVPAVEVRYKGVRDLGVKQGPFYVLFLSSMPSILVETGFLTNRADAKLLRSEKYLETLASSLALGLSRYRDAGQQLALEEPK
jgi:N-acetylmuramoyl-L-alanine amidase